MLVVFVTAAVSLVTFLSTESAASDRFRFDIWTTDNGLPQNTISAVIQTRDGYLWLTTLDGLVRYDGAKFTVFNTGNTEGLETNRFSSLYEDRESALWAGSEDDGLTRYKDGKFVTYTQQDGLPGNNVRGIQGDGGSGILIATDKGIARFQDGKLSSYTGRAGEIDPEARFVGRTGVLWRQTGDRIELLRNGDLITLEPSEDLSRNQVRAAYEDREGALWVGTSGARLFCWKRGVTSSYGTKDGLPNATIISICEDRVGNIWLGAGDVGLVRLRGGKFTIFTKANGLSDDIIMAIYEDREGSIWLGTYRNGLNRLKGQVVSVISESSGLAAHNIYPIYEDHEAAIWIGTWPSGLSRYKDGRYTRYGVADGLAGSHITAIAQDREGNLWVGAYGGVSRFKNGRFEVLYDSKQLASDVVFAIHQDRAGNMWFATNFGVIKYASSSTTRYTTRDGLAGDDVKAILEDRQGNLWFGTYGGISMMAEGGFTNYTKENGLGSNRVRSINEDEEETLWVGTYDGGLSRIKNGRVKTFTMKDGLFNNGAFQVLDDRRGNLWITSNLGIYRVSKQQLDDFANGRIQTFICTSYGKPDGLTNIECNGGTQPAGCRTSDGRLWFPTQDGVAVVDPRDVSSNPQPPPVVIESIAIDRQPSDPRQQIKVVPGQENIEIHYTGLSFIRAENIGFKYKLEGLDRDWVDAGTRRAAYYSHLPPGEYTFKVMAANADGVWNTESVSLRIVVLPPFWRTWWFAAGLISTLLGLTLLVYRRRVATLRRANAAQVAFSRQLIESQESERKRIAAELHDGLGQNLLVIKNWALIGLSSLEGEARGRQQLEEISTTASQTLDEVRQITYNLRPYQLDEVGLTAALQSMLKRIASSSEIRFTTDLEAIDDLFSDDQDISIYRIVQESVNNIIKHSDATEAGLSIKRDARAVQITIQDNGKGFSADALDLNGSRRGFGLTGIAERTHMLGGRHDIRSSPGQGTTITITITLRERQRDAV